MPGRGPESYEAEKITKRMVAPFLKARGFVVANDSFDPEKKSQTQVIQATDPTGHSIRIRVKLCWRSRKTTSEKRPGYAGQLTGMIKDGDWGGAVKKYVERARNKQITHLVFIVREGLEITHAALLPILELAPIWRAQRRTFNALIKKGRLGKSKRNPADNGSSPTLWLVNDEAQEVVDALWNHRGVQEIANIPSDKFMWYPGDVVILPGDQTDAPMKYVGSGLDSVTTVDDTFDDLPGIDSSFLGSDGPPAVPTVRSYVKRDPRVRAVVLRRANGKCERTSCEAARSFSGFFDVHHILGASKSDRVYNCVALCPNCHREAHFAPDRDEINKKLLDFAKKTRSKQSIV